MKNKIIKGKDIEEVNSLIQEHNKKGWLVKQIYAFGIRTTTIYALLEKTDDDKEEIRYGL